ncbi:hypothetical protein CXB51_017854 [Gossypium anomalum]|uniref:Reverse transcriptase Ty1/copia-type domain-containing protein n=1 Tax=Gossypium anomalum TaxID=47600 RepID=A0A8J5Z6F9_9ROSI|nr:hypothetical protein CXB51_017854 [Gossypium anomalum]
MALSLWSSEFQWTQHSTTEGDGFWSTYDDRKGIPKTFWPEAVNWAIHLLNRSPTIVVQNKTPEEAWSGEKPSVGYFRVFGCVAHVHVGDNFRTKLDKRSSELDWNASESNAEMDDDQEEKEIEKDIDDGLSDDDFESHLTVSKGDNPVHFEEAKKNPIWRKAMKKEIEAIERNGTWKLTELSRGAKKIGVKWIFKTKHDENGDVSKRKSGLVVHGYTQEYGIDYTKVFASVARIETIRLVIAIAAHHGWSIYQLDAKSSFFMET